MKTLTSASHLRGSNTDVVFNGQLIVLPFCPLCIRSLTILNRSDVTVHFVWKAFGSESDEEMQKEL